MRAKPLDGQLAFGLFDGSRVHEPFDCPDEGAVVDIGGGKSFCTPWDRWTNCREVGRCVFAECGTSDF